MKKRDKDRLRLWQDRLGRANAAYEPELSKMDGREELYQGCSRIRPIVCTARKKETPHVRNLCAEMIESQVDSNIPQGHAPAQRGRVAGQAHRGHAPQRVGPAAL